METTALSISADILASKTKRFLNVLIDLFIVYLFTIGIGALINGIGVVTGNYQVANWIVSLSVTENVLFGLIVMFIYYFIMEFYFSRTFGKYFTKTLVVKHNGSKPNLKSILIRTLVRFIPVEIFSFFNSNSRGWHDTLSVTYVVKKYEFLAKAKL
jgi:uncharacterized RDD family membrane protein YckC